MTDQVDDTVKLRRVAFPRRRRTGVFGMLRIEQVAVLGVALAVLAIPVFFAGLNSVQVSLIPALVIATVGVVPHPDGRPVLHYLAIGFLFMARKNAGQTTYRAPLVRPATAGYFQLPGGLANIELVRSDNPDYGAITLNPADQTFAAVIRVSSPGWALQAGQDKVRRLDSYSQLLSSLTNHTGLERIQIMLSAIVTSPTAVQDYSFDHRSMDASPWATHQYDQILEHAVRNTAQHQTHIVVVLSRTKLARQIKQSGGGNAGLLAVMAQEVRALGHALEECGLTSELWLGERELAAMIRQAYDPASTPDIDSRVEAFAGVAPHSAGPRAAEEFWRSLRTDSGFHAVYEVTEWPRISVDPDFLAKIVDLPYRHTLSLIARPISLQESVKAIERAKSRIQADRMVRQARRSGKAESAFVQAELEDINRREQEVISGFGDLEFVGMVALTAPDEDQLRAACTSLEQAASQSFIEVRQYYGQQAAAFNSAALPLGITATTPRKSALAGLL